MFHYLIYSITKGAAFQLPRYSVIPPPGSLRTPPPPFTNPPLSWPFGPRERRRGGGGPPFHFNFLKKKSKWKGGPPSPSFPNPPPPLAAPLPGPNGPGMGGGQEHPIPLFPINEKGGGFAVLS
nr:hypothetical protein [Morchella crassipes]